MHARAALLTPLLSALVGLGAQAADGLAAPDEHTVWPQWQARLSVQSTQLTPVSLLDPNNLANTSALLVGDYYFNAPGLRWAATVGGLRATSGLLTSWVAPQGTAGNGGLRPNAGSGLLDATPYLGLGYTGQSLHGGWGFTADLGLALETARLGRAVFGNQPFDSALRDLRLSPVLQLGVRYAF